MQELPNIATPPLKKRIVVFMGNGMDDQHRKLQEKAERAESEEGEERAERAESEPRKLGVVEVDAEAEEETETEAEKERVEREEREERAREAEREVAEGMIMLREKLFLSHVSPPSMLFIRIARRDGHHLNHPHHPRHLNRPHHSHADDDEHDDEHDTETEGAETEETETDAEQDNEQEDQSIELRLRTREVAPNSYCLEDSEDMHMTTCSRYQIMMTVLDFSYLIERVMGMQMEFSETPVHCDYIRLPHRLLHVLRRVKAVRRKAEGDKDRCRMIENANDLLDLIRSKRFRNIHLDGVTHFPVYHGYEIFSQLLCKRREVVASRKTQQQILCAMNELQKKFKKMKVALKEANECSQTLENDHRNMVSQGGVYVTAEMESMLQAIYKDMDHAGLFATLRAPHPPQRSRDRV